MMYKFIFEVIFLLFMSKKKLNVIFKNRSEKNRDLFVNSAFCKNSEKYHYFTLTEMSSFYRDGSILVLDDVIVGSVKNLENNTLLLQNNIYGQNGFLPNGQFCSITPFVNLTRTKGIYQGREWGVFEVEKLILKPGRKSKNYTLKNKLGLHDLIDIEREIVESYLKK